MGIFFLSRVDVSMLRYCFSMLRNVRIKSVHSFKRFADGKESRFSMRNVQECAVQSRKMFYLLMLPKRVFRLRNVHKWAVPSWKGFQLLMSRNQVFRQRNVQKCAVQSCKGDDFLILRDQVFRLRNVHICVVSSCKVGRFADAWELSL